MWILWPIELLVFFVLAHQSYSMKLRAIIIAPKRKGNLFHHSSNPNLACLTRMSRLLARLCRIWISLIDAASSPGHCPLLEISPMSWYLFSFNKSAYINLAHVLHVKKFWYLSAVSSMVSATIILKDLWDPNLQAKRHRYVSKVNTGEWKTAVPKLEIFLASNEPEIFVRVLIAFDV